MARNKAVKATSTANQVKVKNNKSSGGKMTITDSNTGLGLGDYFLALGEMGRKVLVSCLDGMDNMQLNKAILNREGRKALMAAYEGTIIRGFVFPHPELPDLNGVEPGDDYLDIVDDDRQDLVCEGLQWALDKGINVRDFTLDIPNLPEFLESDDEIPLLLLLTRRNAMAHHLIERCTTSYNLNHSGCVWNVSVAFTVYDHSNYGAGLFATEPVEEPTPLEFAANIGNELFVRALIANPSVIVGAGEDREGEDREGALFIAAKSGELDIAAILIGEGKVDVNERNCDGDTPLHGAARGRRPPVVDFLVAKGATLNVLNNEQETPLDILADMKDYCLRAYDMWAALNDKGAVTGEAELQRRRELHPLWFAIREKGDVGEVTALCEKAETNVNMQFPDMEEGKTPLILALYQNREEVVNTLMANNADANLAGNDGWNALHHAAAGAGGKQSLHYVKLLCEGPCEVDVNAKVPHSGMTSLHFAVDADNIEVVQYLIERVPTSGGSKKGQQKADPALTNDSGWTPLQYARFRGKREGIKLYLRGLQQ